MGTQCSHSPGESLTIGGGSFEAGDGFSSALTYTRIGVG